MKRARPRNKKAAQKLMRQRELEYLRRQREEVEILQRAQKGNNAGDSDLSQRERNAPIQEKTQEFIPVNDNDVKTDSTENIARKEDTFSEAEVQPEVSFEQEIPAEDELLADGEPKADTDTLAEADVAESEVNEDKPSKNVAEKNPNYIEERRTDIDLDLPKKTKKKKKGAKGCFTVLLIFMAVILLGIFVVLGFGLFDDSQILAPLEDGKVNVLLMGVDESGLRTDAVLVASCDLNQGAVNMMSIPRDTKIFVKNRRMTRKINEIHAIASSKGAGFIMGAQATAETVQQLTGIPINYYIEFSFASIDHLFDLLGPVEFDVPDVEGNGEGMNYDDPYQDLHIHLAPGLQKLTGNQVQQFLRYRKSNSGKGTGSDTDRVTRQQAFIEAVIAQKVNFATLVKLPSIFSQLTREVNTNISINDVTRYVRYIGKLKDGVVSSYCLPGEAKTVGGGSYFVADLEATKVLVRDTFGYEAEITSEVELSGANPQKPLKVSYVAVTPEPTEEPEQTQEPTPEPTPEPTKAPVVTKEPTEEPTKAPVVTKEPTKAPVVTKEPTKAPVVTKEPTKAPVVTKEPEDEIIILE